MNKQLQTVFPAQEKVSEACDLVALADFVSSIFAQPGQPIDRRFRALLDCACETFSMDYGYITMTQHRDSPIRFSSRALPSLRETPRLDRKATLSRQVIKRRDVLALEDNSTGTFSTMTDQTNRQPKRYLGAPIEFDGRVWGTLEFSSNALSDKALTPAECSMIRLLCLIASGPLVLLGEDTFA